MKIATWNIERLKHKNRKDEILRVCEKIAADILVLTESDERIQPDYPYYFHTPTPDEIKLPQFETPLRYFSTEHRVSIYTNYPLIRQHTTFDAHTALCVELDTPLGNLLVYGTIMGVLGNRHSSYFSDVTKQIEDFKRLFKLGNLCICGDFNCSFSDNYYFTKNGRKCLLNAFAENNLELLTAKQSRCIDHIAISKNLISSRKILIEEWNLDKSLSDHKGVVVDLCE